MCQFQFQRNQYTAEIEICGTLAMRYITYSLVDASWGLRGCIVSFWFWGYKSYSSLYTMRKFRSFKSTKCTIILMPLINLQLKMVMLVRWLSYSQHFQGDILEDPANEPKEDMYMMSVSPENAPSKPEYVINPFSFHRPHLLSWISILYDLCFYLYCSVSFFTKSVQSFIFAAVWPIFLNLCYGSCYPTELNCAENPTQMIWNLNTIILN